jgi:hypothetical protein
VEGEAREEGGLLGGVVPADVGGWICLGVAELGGCGESVFEGMPLGVHAIEDEVRGAVDDAEDTVDSVTGKAVAQRTHDRDGAGNGGFVVELRADLVCGFEELGAVGCEERLVRGDDIRPELIASRM